jgi:hypothetical protein
MSEEVASSADGAVQSAVVVNSIIAVVGALLFLYLRRKLPRIYAPRLFTDDSSYVSPVVATLTFFRVFL